LKVAIVQTASIIDTPGHYARNDILTMNYHPR
jgi:hypothetical protein